MLGTSVLTPTLRYQPSIVAQAFATLACLNPGRVFLGVGTGESLNETPATGAEWPGAKERRLRLAEAIELIRRLWTRRARDLRGRLLPHRPRDDLRPARRAGADLRRRLRAARRQARRSRRRRLHRHERQEAGAVRGAARQPGRGRRAGRPRRRERCRSSSRSRSPTTTTSSSPTTPASWWAALALTPEEKSGVEDPIEMERLADEAADRAHTPLHRLERPRRGRREDRLVRRARLRPPRLPRARRGPEPLPRAVLRRRAAEAAREVLAHCIYWDVLSSICAPHLLDSSTSSGHAGS